MKELIKYSIISISIILLLFSLKTIKSNSSYRLDNTLPEPIIRVDKNGSITSDNCKLIFFEGKKYFDINYKTYGWLLGDGDNIFPKEYYSASNRERLSIFCIKELSLSDNAISKKYLSVNPKTFEQEIKEENWLNRIFGF
jgi:hypothetical protein